MAALIVLIMTLSMMAVVIYSSLFMEKYYSQTKQTSIKNVYYNLKDIVEKDQNIENSLNVEKLNRVCETAGATLIVVDESGNVVYDYGADKMLLDRWRDMVFGQNIDKNETNVLVENGDGYKVNSVEDKNSGDKYYELSGNFSNGNTTIIRMSIESFKESINISNKFYLWIGLITIIIATVIILIITSRYTKPLLALADISSKMSELDFNAKYTGHHNDELGVLGRSMNEMSDKLQQTISELKSANLELQKDIEKKEQIDEMRKDFIANVSHELKTPIALIQGYAEGLQEGITDNPEDTDYYCNVIVDEANKMNKMVKNLLALNQIEFGNSPVNMERFDIVSVIKGIISSMNLQAKKKDVNIQFNHEKSVYVWADEFQIEEVITNYLSNAINHVDENKIIKVEIIEKNGIVRVAVFNTGKNIPDEDIDNIWIKFYKVDKARTRSYGGNGIGLSIVKAIMDRHGKEYGVRNTENGVEFWFDLDCNNLEKRQN
jgi:signal transduction histidine kinase